MGYQGTMRMWMVDPERMCSQHLLGEHNEIHMLIGSLSMKKNLSGFLMKRIIEPGSIRTRHDAIALEMERRGFRHHSPVPEDPDIDYLGVEAATEVDRTSSYGDLLSRCGKCRAIASQMH